MPIHANAERLAKAALCAGNQTKYWEMHKRLFQNKPREIEDIFQQATQVGVELRAFSRCLEDDPGIKARIVADVQLADLLGLQSAPSFVVGRFTDRGRVHVDKLLIGAQPLNTFVMAIEASRAKL